MKKRLLFLVLVILYLTPAALAEVVCPVELNIELSQTVLDGPQEVTVNVTVTNVSGEDMPGPLALYTPDGRIIEEFGMPTLKAGESKAWQGTWFVTEVQLHMGKVIFAVMYTCQAADGSLSRKTQPYYAPVVWNNETPKPHQVKIELAGDPSSGYSWDWGPCNGRIIVDIACEVSEAGDACYTLAGLEAGETTICFTYDEAWYTERDPNFAKYAIYYDIHVDEGLNVSILSTSFHW